MSQYHSVQPRDVSKRTNFGVIIIVAVIMLAGGFVGGMQYQKSKSTSTSGGFQNGQTGGPGGMRQRNGGFGTVTAVSSDSITVSEQSMPGVSSSTSSTTTKTYTITSSTTITNNGSTVSASDIAVGDSVMIQTSSSTSSTATQITVNPTMGGPSGTQSSSTSSTSSN